MKTKNLIVGLLIAAIVCGTGIAGAYDASSPWSGTVRWIVPSDTAFSITWASGESTVDFDENLTSQTQSGIQPDGQDNATSIPIIEISNDGNLALNFTCYLNASKPAWATLKVSNTTDYTNATSFDTAVVTVNASVGAGESTDMYLWTDVTSASAGTSTRYLWINSSTA